LNNPSGFTPYLRFLHSEFAAELLYLWQDVADFLTIDDEDDRRNKMAEIKEMYFNPDSVRFLTDYVPSSETITPADLARIKKEVEDKMHSSFKRFQASKWYKEYVSSVVIQNSLSEIGLLQPRAVLTPTTIELKLEPEVMNN